MSESTSDGERTLREQVLRFLQANFPQVRMHGGTATVADVDEEKGHVTVQLGGTCNGCGLAPMTSNALRERIISEIPELTEVTVNTDGDAKSSGSPVYQG